MDYVNAAHTHTRSRASSSVLQERRESYTEIDFSSSIIYTNMKPNYCHEAEYNSPKRSIRQHVSLMSPEIKGKQKCEIIKYLADYGYLSFETAAEKCWDAALRKEKTELSTGRNK